MELAIIHWKLHFKFHWMEAATRGLKQDALTMKHCCQVAEVLSVAMIVQEGKPQIERAFLICLEEQGMH